MKKLFILSALVAATSLIATKSYSQVYVNAHVGFRVPGARVYVSSGPAYATPAYVAPVPAPVCQDGYDAVAYENEFPGYAYYTYPAWNGHYRDRFYYAHYRPYFEREHYAYFNHGRFDRARFEHERFDRGHYDRGHYDHGRRW
ncbi:MAG TPA: hypothetical protein VL727_02950 [Puia sp.]|nr:hypothetical protein [Puia sp.]